MATQDDSAYQSNPYGTVDPTQLFQQLSQQNQQQPTGAMNQGLMVAGLNPAMQHAQTIQAKLSQILQGVGDADDNEDPLDFQMRQAKAISTGFAHDDPQTALKADQQVLRLQNAKSEQARLNAETAYNKAQTQKVAMANTEAAADPMVIVRRGKDNLGLPTMTTEGTPISMYNEDGTARSGWSTDVAGALKAAGGTPDLSYMRQSQYLAAMEKLNEGRSMATVLGAQMRTQAMLGATLSPDSIDQQARGIIDREIPMPSPPLNTRNPAAVQNYNAIIKAIKDNGVDPASIDASDFKNNTQVYMDFDKGISGQKVQNLNVAMSHMQLMRQWAAALQNNDPATLATTENYVKQMWSRLGGQPAPASFEAARDFVADEISNAVVGARGSALTDREQAQKKLLLSATPQSANSVLDTWTALGGGQLDGLHTRFKSSLQGVPDAKVDARWNSKLSPLVQNLASQSKGGTTQIHTTVRKVGDTGFSVDPASGKARPWTVNDKGERRWDN